MIYKSGMFSFLFIILLTEVKLKSSWILPNKSGEDTSMERLNTEASRRTVTIKALKLTMLL